MLVLTRKRGEQICIGESVVVTVVEIQHNRVRLAIEAPDEVACHRREVWVRHARADVRGAERRE